MTDQWYYTRQGEQVGPVSREQLRNAACAGQLLPSELVWKQGMDDWVPAGKFRELFPESLPVARPLHAATVSPAQPKPASRQKNASPPAEAAKESFWFVTRNLLACTFPTFLGRAAPESRGDAVRRFTRHPTGKLVGIISSVLLALLVFASRLARHEQRRQKAVEPPRVAAVHSAAENSTPPTVTHSDQAATSIQTRDYRSPPVIELTADFHPFQPGTQLRYRAERSTDAGIMRTYETETQESDGLISSLTDVSELLDKGHKLVERKSVEIRATEHYRITKTHVEDATDECYKDEGGWSPVLMLGAKQGDKWTHSAADELEVRYELAFIGDYKDHAVAAVTDDTVMKGKLLARRITWYVKGLGQVRSEGGPVDGSVKWCRILLEPRLPFSVRRAVARQDGGGPGEPLSSVRTSRDYHRKPAGFGKEWRSCLRH